MEKIPNKCKDDLKLHDVRLLRPTVLVIHDNFKKRIFYIVNVYKDEKIFNYKKKYLEVKKEINQLIFQASNRNNKIVVSNSSKKLVV